MTREGKGRVGFHLDAPARIGRIQEVCGQIHLMDLCRSRGGRTGEDALSLAQQVQLRLWDTWPEEFDLSDRPFPDRPRLTVQGWAWGTARNVIREVARDMLRAGVTCAPEGVSFGQFDAQDPSDLWLVASILTSGSGRRRLIRILCRSIDVTQPYQEVWARASEAVHDVRCAIVASGEPTDFADIVRLCESRRDPALANALRDAVMARYHGRPFAVASILAHLHSTERR